MACTGRHAYPLESHQADDHHFSCQDIREEIAENQEEMRDLLPKSKKFWKNTALAAAGTMLIVPFFFMDFSKAEQKEIIALQTREDHLFEMGRAKRCSHLPAQLKLIKEQRNKAHAKG